MMKKMTKQLWEDINFSMGILVKSNLGFVWDGRHTIMIYDIRTNKLIAFDKMKIDSNNQTTYNDFKNFVSNYFKN